MTPSRRRRYRRRMESTVHYSCLESSVKTNRHFLTENVTVSDQTFVPHPHLVTWIQFCTVSHLRVWPNLLLSHQALTALGWVSALCLLTCYNAKQIICWPFAILNNKDTSSGNSIVCCNYLEIFLSRVCLNKNVDFIAFSYWSVSSDMTDFLFLDSFQSLVIDSSK